MNARIPTLAALALVLGACAPPDSPPDSPDEPPESGARADRDRQDAAAPATDDDGGYGQSADTQLAAASDLSALVGKMVVDPGGKLLGTSQRVLKKTDSEQKLVVVSVSNGAREDEQEVLVPVEELRQGTLPGKLKLDMTMEQLAAQPPAEAEDKGYVVLQRRTDKSEAAPDDASRQEITGATGTSG